MYTCTCADIDSWNCANTIALLGAGIHTCTRALSAVAWYMHCVNEREHDSGLCSVCLILTFPFTVVWSLIRRPWFAAWDWATHEWLFRLLWPLLPQHEWHWQGCGCYNWPCSVLWMWVMWRSCVCHVTVTWCFAYTSVGCHMTVMWLSCDIYISVYTCTCTCTPLHI